MPLDQLRTTCNADLGTLENALTHETSKRGNPLDGNGKLIFEKIERDFIDTLATFEDIVQECLPAGT